MDKVERKDFNMNRLEEDNDLTLRSGADYVECTCDKRGHKSFQLLYLQIKEITMNVKVPRKWKKDTKIR